jgi:hypothetical protein
MHNLSGVYVKEEPQETVNGLLYYPFSVLYPNKKRIYYCENADEARIWVKSIKKATGFVDLADIYEVKVYLLLNNNNNYILAKIRKWKIWSSKARHS